MGVGGWRGAGGVLLKGVALYVGYICTVYVYLEVELSLLLGEMKVFRELVEPHISRNPALCRLWALPDVAFQRRTRDPEPSRRRLSVACVAMQDHEHGVQKARKHENPTSAMFQDEGGAHTGVGMCDLGCAPGCCSRAPQSDTLSP